MVSRGLACAYIGVLQVHDHDYGTIVNHLRHHYNDCAGVRHILFGEVPHYNLQRAKRCILRHKGSFAALLSVVHIYTWLISQVKSRARLRRDVSACQYILRLLADIQCTRRCYTAARTPCRRHPFKAEAQGCTWTLLFAGDGGFER